MASGFSLVLGGGGAVGLGYVCGVLHALEEVTGVDLGTADVLIGTSVGAVVAADLRLGRPILDIYADRARPTDEDDEPLVTKAWSSRTDLARTADAERTLREIAGRVSATHDQDEILQAVIDASVRLLGATGAMIDLLGDTGMAEAWSTREAGVRAQSSLSLLNEITLAADAGVSGRSLQTRQVEWTGSYLRDKRFRHTKARDSFVREAGIQSVIAAPLMMPFR